MPFAGRTGNAGTPPAYDALLRAAGFKKAVVTDTSVTYTPNTQNDMADTPSLTAWLYKYRLDNNQSLLYKASGYRGNVTITLAIGEEAVIAGSGKALYTAAPTAGTTKPTAPTAYVGDDCMVVTSLTVTVGGTTYPVERLEIQSNWQVTEVRTGTAAGGALSEVLLTRPMSGGRMIGSLDLIDGATALLDMITKMQSGAEAQLVAVLTNGTKTTTLTAPKMQFGQYSEAAAGFLRYTCPLYFNRNSSGDDELTIVYT